MKVFTSPGAIASNPDPVRESIKIYVLINGDINSSSGTVKGEFTSGTKYTRFRVVDKSLHKEMISITSIVKYTLLKRENQI